MWSLILCLSEELLKTTLISILMRIDFGTQLHSAKLVPTHCLLVPFVDISRGKF